MILHGEASIVQPDRELALRLAAASDAKYGRGHLLAHCEGQELVVFAPSTILAWAPLYENATRFVVKD